MGDINISFDGVSAIVAELEALKSRMNRATEDATTKTGDRLRHTAILNFHGSHPPGFHHVGGDAPNIVSGNLAWSIVAPPSVNVGTGRYMTRVGPTAIYARVIEFGAHITPKERQYLSWFDAQVGTRRYLKEVNIPPHPYFTPAYEETPPQMRQIFSSAWERAWMV